MAKSFRELKDNLEVYFFNSQFDMMKTAEDYLSNNPNEVNEIYQYSTTSSNINSNPDFYGYDPNSSLTLEEQYSYDQLKLFSDLPLLAQVIDKFDIIKRGLDLGGDFDASKIKFTSLPRGVFNFGLASKGLIRKTEFYDEESKLIIEDNLVKQEKLNDLKIFYYLKNGEKKPVRKQQKGTMLVKNNFPDVDIQFDQKQQLWLPYKDNKVFNGKGKNMLKYSTTTKKVYMYREKLGGGVSPYVDLFIGVSASAELNTENMLAKNLSSFIVADILEKAGVKVRIYGLRSFDDSPNTILTAFAVKEYGEPLDFGRLASFTSDNRFFRVSLWRAIATIRKIERGSFSYGYGNALYGGNDNLYNAFAMFKNFIFNSKGTLKYDTKINDKNLMVLSGLPKVTASDKLTGTNEDITFSKIQDEIYRTLDYVGMLLTKNPKTFISKIYKREREKQIPKSKQEIKDYLENLITSNLTIVPQFDSDKDSFENRFSTPANEVPRITERTNELIDYINQTIV